MSTQALNYDILFMLFSRIRSRKTLLAFMCTCWQLYNAGIPWLLRLRYRVTPEKLPSFYAFLLADPSSRFAAISDLYIPDKILDDQVGIISDIIRRASNLEALQIHTDSLHIRDISLALESLPKLEQLQLDGLCSVEAQAVLVRLQCPLKRLQAHCLGNGSYHATVNLSRFQLTLEQFVGGYYRIVTQDSICFPKVVSFHGTFFVTLDMSSLMMFSNLKMLYTRSWVRHFNEVIEDLPPWTAGTHNTLRTANIAYQERRGSWYSLVYLNTDMLSLYTLAVRCRVESLTINKINIAGTGSHSWFYTTLTSLRPTYLRIHSLVGRPSRFAELFGARGMEDVQKLYVNLILTSTNDGEYNEVLVSSTV